MVRKGIRNYENENNEDEKYDNKNNLRFITVPTT